MKKLMFSFLCLLIVVGCGSNAVKEEENPKDNKKVTTCVIDTPYSNYASAKQVIHSEGDIAKLIAFEGKLIVASKEQIDAIIPQLDTALEAVNTLEGVSASYERLDDTTLLDKAEYDLEKASVATLQQIGLFASTDEGKNATFISVDMTVSNLEANGFKCTGNK